MLSRRLQDVPARSWDSKEASRLGSTALARCWARAWVEVPVASRAAAVLPSCRSRSVVVCVFSQSLQYARPPLSGLRFSHRRYARVTRSRRQLVDATSVLAYAV